MCKETEKFIVIHFKLGVVNLKKTNKYENDKVIITHESLSPGPG